MIASNKDMEVQTISQVDEGSKAQSIEGRDVLHPERYEGGKQLFSIFQLLSF